MPTKLEQIYELIERRLGAVTVEGIRAMKIPIADNSAESLANIKLFASLTARYQLLTELYDEVKAIVKSELNLTEMPADPRPWH